jgi:hypothetical protein
MTTTNKRATTATAEERKRAAAARKERAERIRSLIEDSGYSRRDAAALVDAGG